QDSEEELRLRREPLTTSRVDGRPKEHARVRARLLRPRRAAAARFHSLGCIRHPPKRHEAVRGPEGRCVYPGPKRYQEDRVHGTSSSRGSWAPPLLLLGVRTRRGAGTRAGDEPKGVLGRDRRPCPRAGAASRSLRELDSPTFCLRHRKPKVLTLSR